VGVASRLDVRREEDPIGGELAHELPRERHMRAQQSTPVGELRRQRRADLETPCSVVVASGRCTRLLATPPIQLLEHSLERLELLAGLPQFSFGRQTLIVCEIGCSLGDQRLLIRHGRGGGRRRSAR